MRNFLVITFLMTLSVSASPVGAAGVKLDGSAPLLCVPIEITECEEGGKCYHGTAEDVNLPQFIRVNLKEKTLSGFGEAAGRTTPIDVIETENGKTVLHGGQNGRAWSALISAETGKLVATISAEGTAFVIFGACTTL